MHALCKPNMTAAWPLLGSFMTRKKPACPRGEKLLTYPSRMQATANPHPILSSPYHLFAAGLAILLAVLTLQAASGVPPWHAFAPVEFSHSAVASAGLAWALVQLRAHWSHPTARKAWLAATFGMGLLAIESVTGSLLLLLTPLRREQMAVTIVIWMAAAVFLFRAGRHYAMRRSVMPAFRNGFALQVATLVVGWFGTADVAMAGTHIPEYLYDGGELVTALTYATGLLLAVFAPVKTYRYAASAVGRKGRELFADFGLRKRARYPTRIAFLHLPVIRPLFLALMALAYFAWCGPGVRRGGGPGITKQLFSLMALAREGIDAHSYYFLPLYRGGATHGTDAFVTRVETKNGLIKAINATPALRRGSRELGDKLAFARTCEQHGVPAVPVLATVSAQRTELHVPMAQLDRDLFVKDRSGFGAKFARAHRRLSAYAWDGTQGEELGLDQLLAQVRSLERPGGVIVQPKLENHPSIAFLTDGSLVVFRVITCLDAAGQPRVTHGMLRILGRQEARWPAFARHEWGAPVALDTGLLGALVCDSAKDGLARHSRHPVNGAQVEGTCIAAWPEIAGAAVQAHRVFGGRALVGWDIAWTPDGVRVVEGNSNLDLAFIQRCHGKPVGESALAPMLDWHLDNLLRFQRQKFGV